MDVATTRGQHGPTPGPSGALLVVSDLNDAPCLAPIARMSWMLAGHVSGPTHGHPIARSRWYGRAYSGRSDRHHPLLGGHGDEELLGQLLD